MYFAILANLSDVLLWTLFALSALGFLCVAYGVLEARLFRRVSYRIEALPAPSAGPMTVLHLSDLHLVARDRAKARFLGSLPRPDVCVVTGDILGEPQAVEACVGALRPVRGRLASFFVLGSNDYFAPRPLNYFGYFRRGKKRRPGIRRLAEDLVAGLEADGWTHLRNRKLDLSYDGIRLEVVGLDDPHIERHDIRVAARHSRAFGLAVVHSPDPAPELAVLGYDLILCGHTHGGQVRMPFVGALVTNSAIPTRLCMGLSRLGTALLHVSPGLGTSKYAPFRFLCRPEATELELAPRGTGGTSTGAEVEDQSDTAAGAEAATRSNTRS